MQHERKKIIKFNSLSIPNLSSVDIVDRHFWWNRLIIMWIHKVLNIRGQKMILPNGGQRITLPRRWRCEHKRNISCINSRSFLCMDNSSAISLLWMINRWVRMQSCRHILCRYEWFRNIRCIIEGIGQVFFYGLQMKNPLYFSLTIPCARIGLREIQISNRKNLNVSLYHAHPPNEDSYSHQKHNQQI